MNKMPILKGLFSKAEPKKFLKREKVIISNNLDEIKEKQEKCGGFSPSKMMHILGNTAVVICVRTECITVAVQGRRYDLHPDLLHSISDHANNIQQYSLPEKIFVNDSLEKRSTQSFPVCSMNDENILSLFFPPIDNEPISDSTVHDISTWNNTSVNVNCNSKLLSRMFSEQMPLIDPPVDIEEEDKIDFDLSLQTISIQWKDKEEETPLDIYEEMPSMNNSFNHSSKILCQKCKQRIIEFALFCGHCYCQMCLEQLQICNICHVLVEEKFLKIYF